MRYILAIILLSILSLAKEPTTQDKILQLQNEILKINEQRVAKEIELQKRIAMLNSKIDTLSVEDTKSLQDELRILQNEKEDLKQRDTIANVDTELKVLGERVENYAIIAIASVSIISFFLILLGYATINEIAKKQVDKIIKKGVKQKVDSQVNSIIGELQAQLSQTEKSVENLKAIEVESIFNIALTSHTVDKPYKNIDRAIKYYKMAIAKGSIDAMYNLGLLYRNQEEYDKAIEYYKMAIKEGNHVVAMNNLGLLYDNQGEYNKAIKYYEMAIAKGNVDVMCNLGVLYYNQKEYGKAIKYWEMAIKEGNQVDAMNNLGLLYANQGEYDRAIEYYEMAIKEGNDVGAMNNLAYLYLSVDEYRDIDEADRLIDTAISKEPNRYRLYPLKAMAIAQRGGSADDVVSMLRNCTDSTTEYDKNIIETVEEFGPIKDNEIFVEYIATLQARVKE
jgi:TPR repeat protein